MWDMKYFKGNMRDTRTAKLEYIRDSTHSHFCISIVSSWDGCNTQEKWKTKVAQNFGGQTWCIMGDVQMANRVSGHSLWPKILRVICSVLNITKRPALFAESFDPDPSKVIRCEIKFLAIWHSQLSKPPSKSSRNCSQAPIAVRMTWTDRKFPIRFISYFKSQ